jgi:hypothetical protein
LSKPIDPLAPKRWCDVEAGCYNNEELPIGLEPIGQESLAAFSPAQYYPSSPYNDNDKNAQRIIEEPTSRSLTKLLDEVSGKESDNNVSQPKGDLVVAFLDEMTSSIVSSAFTPCRSLQPSHPYIDQVGFLLNSQDEEEDPQRPQQQQEVGIGQENHMTNEDTRQAKQRKLRLAPAYEGLTP